MISTWENRGNEPITYAQLGQRFNLKKTTVYQMVRRYQETGNIADKPGRGRKPALTVRETKDIVREATKNPFTTSSKLKEIVQERYGKDVSSRTVRKYLNKEGIHGRTARKKPLISKVNQRKRLNFARKHINEPPEYWKRVLWTDESKINLFGSDCGTNVWRKKNEALKFQNTIPTVKHGGGNIMVWGSMASNGVGNLEFIDVKMNAEVYVDILNRNMKSSAQKLGLGRRYIFQQDNDPKHTSKKAQLFFKKSKVNVMEWPPQSPDLNPIEHLWGTLKRAVYSSPSSSINQLKVKVQEEWDLIDPGVTEALVNSMPRRLQAVIEANGGSTKY